MFSKNLGFPESKSHCPEENNPLPSENVDLHKLVFCVTGSCEIGTESAIITRVSAPSHENDTQPSNYGKHMQPSASHIECTGPCSQWCPQGSRDLCSQSWPQGSRDSCCQRCPQGSRDPCSQWCPQRQEHKHMSIHIHMHLINYVCVDNVDIDMNIEKDMEMDMDMILEKGLRLGAKLNIE